MDECQQPHGRDRGGTISGAPSSRLSGDSRRSRDGPRAHTAFFQGGGPGPEEEGHSRPHSEATRSAAVAVRGQVGEGDRQGALSLRSHGQKPRALPVTGVGCALPAGGVGQGPRDGHPRRLTSLSRLSTSHLVNPYQAYGQPCSWRGRLVPLRYGNRPRGRTYSS